MPPDPGPLADPSLPGIAEPSAVLDRRLAASLAQKGEDYEPRTHHKGDDGPAYTNRLIDETSPYLLQHAHNPVNWFPWGPLAFERARELDKPVLAINSFEFNNEGAKHLDVLMEHGIRVVQDVAVRAEFRHIYAGISDYGRAWLDRHYKQAEPGTVVDKVHAPEAGYRYHFDVFRRRWSLEGGLRRSYVYSSKRGLFARLYALIFGGLEIAKGNRAKALAFWDTVRNTHNMWEIPVPSDQRE